MTYNLLFNSLRNPNNFTGILAQVDMSEERVSAMVVVAVEVKFNNCGSIFGKAFSHLF